MAEQPPTQPLGGAGDAGTPAQDPPPAPAAKPAATEPEAPAQDPAPVPQPEAPVPPAPAAPKPAQARRRAKKAKKEEGVGDVAAAHVEPWVEERDAEVPVAALRLDAGTAEGQIRPIKQTVDHYKTMVEIPLTGLARMTIWRVKDNGMPPLYFFLKNE